MRIKLLVCFLASLFIQNFILGQGETYTVTLAPFSSDKYDEFSPVFYKGGIVFCSNRSTASMIRYSGSTGKSFFKLYYFKPEGRSSGKNPELFSKTLTSNLNDGPVTFNRLEDTIYYSRNLEISGSQKDLSGPQNKLGIFAAAISGKKWTMITEFRLNNEWYNITTPALSPDGEKLYFASDKPGGFGGSDLYYCQWNGSYWSEPVNLGSVINTAGNESYPYVNSSGDLFFSSDGRGGLGGKDIYFSRFSGSDWLPPVHPDAPINSKYDDFGIITDTLFTQGYFSSDRKKTLDIYHFKTNYPQIFYANIQKEDQYCFMFDDNGSITADTTYLRYRWDFGDGKTSGKTVVSHCYSAPGNYKVRLDIINRGTGKIFFSKLRYSFTLRDFEQPYINCSDIALVGETVGFDAYKSNLPGQKIINYLWDFGDGKRSSGAKVNHSFSKKGEYTISLELVLRSASTGNVHKEGVSKKFEVLAGQKEKTDYEEKISSAPKQFPDIRNCENALIASPYSAESEFQKDIVFGVEILSSKEKIALSSSLFRNVPADYTIKEKLLTEDGSYSYIITQQMSLMATYPAYSEMLSLGFKDARIRAIPLKDPAEKELFNLMRKNGVSAETYFDPSDRLTSNAYIMLEQLANLLNKYPSVTLQISVHSDNTGSAEKNMVLTQKHSQLLVGYLVNRGINAKRLTAKGFGESQPIAPNYLKKDRLLNQRIDFEII